MTRTRQNRQDVIAASEPAPVPPERPSLSGLDFFEVAQQISDEYVWHWDMTRGTLHWSPQIAALLGITKSISVLSGDPFQTFLHPDDLVRATSAINAHIKKGTPYRLEERLVTKAGTYSWFLVRGKAARNKEGKPLSMTGYLTDISRLKQEAVEREKELVQTRDLAKDMTVLNELSKTLTTRLTVDEVVWETYKQASRLIDTRNFMMSLYNPELKEHEFVLNLTESEVDKELLKRQPANLGISGYIIHNRVPVLIRDNADKWATSHGIQPLGEMAYSWLGVPLLLGDHVLGIIIVQNYHQEGVYDEHDRDLLMTIASSAAVALQNARLFSEKQEAEAESIQRANRIKALLAPMQESMKSIHRLSTLEESSKQHSALPEIAIHADAIAHNVQDILRIMEGE
jgi:PAS domain S-box-containing protein